MYVCLQWIGRVDKLSSLTNSARQEFEGSPDESELTVQCKARRMKIDIGISMPDPSMLTNAGTDPLFMTTDLQRM